MDEISRRERESLSTADLAQTGDKRMEEEIAREPTAENGSAGENRTSTASQRTQESAPVASPSNVRQEATTPLFATNEAASLRSRWESLQVEFVDEPRRSVEQADQLVAEAIKRLAEGFAGEKQNLERQWDRGDKVSTEDLRQSLRRYRSFFERLLAV